MTPAPEHDLYLFVGEWRVAGEFHPSAMYRLACRECGEAFEEGETPVPSRSIVGGPLVHEACAGEHQQ